jgi:heat shock protein HtpX
MVFFKRILLFFIVNTVVLFTITLLVQLLGLERLFGNDMQALFAICLIYGMLGSLISLLLSKRMVKWMMRIHTIDPQKCTPAERRLFEMTRQLSQKAGLSTMPEIGIFKSVEINAFATGPSKNKSLVAVSSALLEKLDDKKVEAILGHEMAHIVNGDMVTLSLIQGVINAFVMFFARVLAFVVSNALLSKGKERSGGGHFFMQYFLIQVFQIIFGLLGFLVVALFSRWREYRADRHGAFLTSKGQMIEALESLKLNVYDKTLNKEALNAFKIDHQSKWLAIFSTHPTLDKRIKALRALHE